MQMVILEANDRFYVRVDEDALDAFPPGAFSTMASYPVYAMRVRELGENDLTEFLVPASDNAFYWLDMRLSRMARRQGG